jgi:hypothetical protein
MLGAMAWPLLPQKVRALVHSSAQSLPRLVPLSTPLGGVSNDMLACMHVLVCRPAALWAAPLVAGRRWAAHLPACTHTQGHGGTARRPSDMQTSARRPSDMGAQPAGRLTCGHQPAGRLTCVAACREVHGGRGADAAAAVRGGVQAGPRHHLPRRARRPRAPQVTHSPPAGGVWPGELVTVIGLHYVRERPGTAVGWQQLRCRWLHSVAWRSM